MNYSLADIENLDFRAACPPMPEDLKQEIMAMVRSFQEEKKAPVTAPRRFALIFALLRPTPRASWAGRIICFKPSAFM